MSKKDIFGDDVDTAASDFATLFEKSIQSGTRQLKKGDSLRGEIVSVHGDSVFISTGTPCDGVVPKVELLNAERQFVHKIGDFIDVIVLRVTPEEILLRYKSAKSVSKETESLEDAFDMEVPVEGRVTEVVKGGFRVEVARRSAFCPVSQIDLKVDVDHGRYVGRRYDFIITQFENQGRNVVVSRRKLLELQKADNEGQFLQKYKVGDVLQGRVCKLEKFGAFVELEAGVEGLVHISEVAWGRISLPSDVLTLDQAVQVKILKIDDADHLRISLSIKEGGGAIDPWVDFQQKFKPGSKFKGTIEKKENFGYFVQIVPGIQGLFPRSKWRDSSDAQAFENKKKGDVLDLQIDQLDADTRKALLSLPGDEFDDSWKSHSGSGKSGLGTFGDLLSKAQQKNK